MASIDTIADRSTGTTIAGKAYFETSTNQFIVYNGSSWIQLDSDGVGAVYENRWGASFDGTNDFVNLGSSSDFDSVSAFTISSWIKADSFSGYPMILAKTNATVGKAFQLYIDQSTSKPTLAVNFSSFASSTDTISTGAWTHIAVTWTSGTGAVAFYINGSASGTATGSTSITANTDDCCIGAKPSGGGFSNYFNGLIDEVAFFNSALSGADITAIYNSGTPTDLSSYSPVGWWRMGDDSSDTATSGGSIATITDSSGNGNDAVQATASNQPAFKALDSSTTSSLSFDGSQYLESGTSSVFDVSSGFSISAWLKPNSSSQYNMIAYRRTGANGYQFFSLSSALKYYGGNGNQTLNTALNLDQWNHVVLVHTGSQITGYVNGVAGTSLADSYTTPGTTDFYVGRHPGAASYNLDGELDEFAFFNTALSASDVASLAASRGAHIINDLSLSPLAYYRMGEDDSLTNGASASQITDASGNGYHATQATAAAQPTASVSSVIYV